MLDICNIDVCYGDIQALWDVSLTIDDGKIVTIVGSNGAGKSTIMQAVTGLNKLKSGKILFNGECINNLPAHLIVESGICMVPEGRRLFPRMSILENLEVGASVKAARKVRKETIGIVYDFFPILKERSKQKAGTLSGGEQQMLAIGRALMSRPKILLIDEMSLGLSPLIVKSIARILKELNKTMHLTIVLVEQDVQLALAIADQGYIIENGRITGHGDAKSLLCNEDIKEAYLGIGKVR